MATLIDKIDVNVRWAQQRGHLNKYSKIKYDIWLNYSDTSTLQ